MNRAACVAWLVAVAGCGVVSHEEDASPPDAWLPDLAGDAAPVDAGARVPWNDVVALEHSSCALRDDGSVWCWGRNAEGQLGTGGAGATATPTRVPSLGEVVDITAGQNLGYSQQRLPPFLINPPSGFER